MNGASAAAQPFNPRVVLLIVAAALIAFIAFLALAAYAPDFRSGRNGQAHALSVSGDGYAGLVQLTKDVGAYPLLVRDEAGLATQDLLIVTPPPMGDPDALDRLLSFRGNAPTLIVLPKWATVPMPGRSGWVQAIGAVGTGASALSKIAPHLGLIAGTKLPRAAHPPKGVPRLARARIGRQALQQRLSGSGFRPVLLDADGRVVIAAIPNLPIYVLAEPDLLNNQGLADPWVARQGWRIVDDLATTNEIAFDLTLNGFARGKSTLKLLFEPPFAAVSLCVLLAALLAGLHGLARFGAAAEPGRAIAFGKRALVDNAAQLFRAARKEHRAGGAYALLTRDLAAQAVAAPRALSGEALATWLDAAAPEADDPPFATLAWHAEAAANRTELLAAARALYRWRRNRTG